MPTKYWATQSSKRMFSSYWVIVNGRQDSISEKSIGQVQPHKRFLLRFASVVALLTVLAIAGVGWMVVFAGLLIGYHKKLKRLHYARQLVTRPQELHLSKSDFTTVPSSYRASDQRESFPGAEEVGGYNGCLGSPSWRSNRFCG
jgi:hypothetical protein